VVREPPQGLALLFSHKAKQRNGVQYEGSDAQDASRREAVKNQPKGPAAAQQNGGGNSSTAARRVETFTQGDLILSAAQLDVSTLGGVDHVLSGETVKDGRDIRLLTILAERRRVDVGHALVVLSKRITSGPCWSFTQPRMSSQYLMR